MNTHGTASSLATRRARAAHRTPATHRTRATRRTRGFTLVELLVVISIIALLIAMLLPSLGRARFEAQKITCRSSIRQLSLGAFAYGADNDSSVMYGTKVGYTNYTLSSSNWYWQIPPYISGERVVTSLHVEAPKLLREGCPYSRIGTTFRNSYGMNFLLDSVSESWPKLDTPHTNQPNRVVYFMDCWVASVDRFTGLTSGAELTRTLNGTPDNYDNIPVHDGEGLSTLFMDGHADYLTRDEVLTGYGQRHVAPW